MIVPDYVPGAWVAVVTDGTVAVLPPEADPALVEQLWASVRSGASLTDHLQLLLAAGIAALPPFALVRLSSGKVHAIVRGAVRVEVRTGAGTRVLSAQHVQTWSEETVDDATGVSVRTTRGEADGPALPVLSGVVRVAEVRVELGAPAGPRADAEALAAAPGEDVPAVGAAAAVVAPVGPADPGAGAPFTGPVPVLEDDPVLDGVPEAGPVVLEVPGDPLATSPRTTAYVPPAPPAPEPHDDDPLDAPARPAWARVGAVPAAGPVHAEDHDGLTVLSSDVVALRRQLPDWAGDAVPGPLAVPTPRSKAPAKIQLSSGLVVSLNRPVLLGRAPQVTRVANSEIPRLVTVPSPNQDISRTHAEVRMDGDDVLVTDLRSTNGVLLLRQGASPQRLHPGEPTTVEPGVVVDLGEGVTFIVEAGG